MNTSFELIILKSLTHSGAFFGKVMPILDKTFFQEVGQVELFGLVQTHYSEYHKIPSLTELVASVKNVPNVEVRKCVVQTLQSLTGIETVANTEFLVNETVKWVKDAMYLEALRLGSDGLMQKSDSLKLQAQAVMDARSKVTVDSDLGISFRDIDDMIAYYTKRDAGIRSQHDSLNKRLGPGFIPGTLSVVLAPAGGGKSLFLTDLITGMIQDGKRCLLVSLEMQDREIMKRVHANSMSLPINSLTDLNKTDAELKRISRERDTVSETDIRSAFGRLNTSGTLGDLHIKDYPAGAFTALQLESLVESYSIEMNVTFDIIFLDYIGIMKSDLVTPSAGLYAYVKSIGEEVRAVAKKLALPIVSCSQLNRGAVGNTDADNSVISDSMGTAMTADFMLFLLQDEEMKKSKEIVCKVTKNRFTGITDTWMMNVDYRFMRFNDMVLAEDVNAALVGTTSGPVPVNPITEDYGIITVAKQTAAVALADTEIRNIAADDYAAIRAHDKNADTTAPDDMDDILKTLGL